MITIAKDDLSEGEFEAVVQSRGFQKMLLYQRLADGIEVLQTHDLLYESMVRAITEQHSEIESIDTTREVLEHLEHEVATYTEPLTAGDSGESQLPLEETTPLEEATTGEVVETSPEQMVQKYLENCLTENDELEVKAKEIASAIGLRSTHIGAILGQWRQADDAPFAISASESPGSSNLWTIRRATSR